MRVISGTCRGRVLSAPTGMITRPTSDRVKEAIFSILGSRLNFNDISVLDICAGSGSLGIEALSRGAGSCCFVESSRSVGDVLKKNILSTGLQERSRILIMDAEKAINSLEKAKHKFNIVFFDPPYSSGLYQRIFELFDNSDLLASEALLLAECSVRNPLSEVYGHLKRFDRRIYGETAIEMFSKEAN
ncbi:MAG: 16S rRNA (guanine(966)-N(2))-methyltransferase RsmD [Desulfuromonadaceae bacterium]|nr:16S rRNA (guanine(966)-N(2))-methyltransferase RsmD [Desulfuromonadaceae bacterium]MDD2856227.1 16S rRNA (guanine(966)-N(2))-methyltransferase RsmD [Desulfuromonadaceae bacterium]